MQKQKIGVMFGSFNPPHKGHLAVLKCAKQQHNLDKIIVIPIAHSPLKTHIEQASYQDKMQMCHIAFEGLKNFEICQAVQTDTKNKYLSTIKSIVHTLRLIQKEHPSSQIELISGDDFQKKFKRIQQIARILSKQVVRSSLGLLSQFNSKANLRVLDILEKVGTLATINLSVFNRSAIADTSSTEIRKALQNKEPSCPHSLKNSVHQYIKRRGLYSGQNNSAL